MSAVFCSADAASRSLLSAYASWALSMRRTLQGSLCSRRFDAWVFAMPPAEATRAASPPTADRSSAMTALRNISDSLSSPHARMTARRASSTA
jgi:hypothetical protein